MAMVKLLQVSGTDTKLVGPQLPFNMGGLLVQVQLASWLLVGGSKSCECIALSKLDPLCTVV